MRSLINDHSIVFRLALLCCGLLATPRAECGELITHVIESEKLSNNIVGLSLNREIKVLLPDNYDEGRGDYPVVYWFPGGEQPPTANLRPAEIDAEFASGRAVESIVVFMDTRSEINTSLFLSSDVFGDWEGHLTSEVIPFVDSNYRTQASPDKRGIMGFSVGGLTSLMIPLFAPGNFGAVGMNDPSSSFTSGAVRNGDEVPEGYVPPDEPVTLEEFFGRFPESVAGYGDATVGTSIYGQLAVKLTPNPNDPLLGNIPFTRDGQWLDDVRETWREFDFLDPNSVAGFADKLQPLATMSVILPEQAKNTNMPWNRAMVEVFQDAGINATGINFEGDHNDFQQERFLTLLSDVSYALKGENKTILSGNGHTNNFNSLGLDDTQSTALPAGWSVSTNRTGVFRDQTNTPFSSGNAEVAGHGPHILNVGDPNNFDRSLAIHLQGESDSAAIQLLADITEIDANAVQLKFDVEAWDKLAAATETEQVGFHVTAEFEFGDGHEEFIDFGEFTFGETLTIPTADLLDGNANENRASFDVIGGAPILEATTMRLLFTADSSVATEGWVFGIDDVELNFSYLGDFDGDNILTTIDIDLLTEAGRSGGDDQFDINSDGTIDGNDLDFWVGSLFGTVPGDANLDKQVDFTDFLLFTRNFGKQTTEWQSGDFDGDGNVGFSDFLRFSRNFGVSSRRVRSNSVPEPATHVGFLIGLFIATGYGRRRRPNKN